MDEISAELNPNSSGLRAQRPRPGPCVLGPILLFVWGCGPAAPLLSNAHPSSFAVATAVLDALAVRDAAALRALALSEEEFREHVWPELPAARPGRNLPFSYVWGDLQQKSDGALERTLDRRGGRRYQLVSVRFAGGSTSYPRYRVHRETVLQIRDEHGETREMRLFGSSLEMDGAWKVFSYAVD